MIVAMQSVDTLMSAIAMTTPRVLGAFLMLPLLTQENTPAMVRNSILISLAVIAVPAAMISAPTADITMSMWPALLVKEIFLGSVIGFCFGTIFWAIGAAGIVIDTQVGMSMATIMDPIQGHQASLHGQFLSQLAAWLFMASGAFLVFLDILLSSYAVWPVTSFYPSLQPGGMEMFIGQFAFLMSAVVVMAAPVMVFMLLVDLVFGLMNRFAPQLNVFALTMPIKAWVATAMIFLLIGLYAEIIMDRLMANRGLLEALQKIFGP